MVIKGIGTSDSSWCSRKERTVMGTELDRLMELVPRSMLKKRKGDEKFLSIGLFCQRKFSQGVSDCKR